LNEISEVDVNEIELGEGIKVKHVMATNYCIGKIQKQSEIKFKLRKLKNENTV